MNHTNISLPQHVFLAMQGYPESSTLEDTTHLQDLDGFSPGFNISAVRNSSKVTTFQTAIWYLNLYLTPGIILVGLVGNLLSFLVFTSTHVQRLSASIYLSSLAVADIFSLLVLLIVWMDQRLGVVVFVTEGWCQFIVYIKHVAGFIAVWYVLGFTAERYIIAYHPLMKDVLCTRQKAIIVVVCLCLFALLFYSYVILTYDVIRFGSLVVPCSPLLQYHDITNILMSIDTLIACVIPSLVIVILNIKIIIKIHQYQQKRSNSQSDLSHYRVTYRNRSQLHTSISTTGNVHIRFSAHPINVQAMKKEKESQEMTQCQAAVRTRSHFRTARMLLVLSSVFVLLNLPYHIFGIHSFLGHLIGVGPKEPKNKMAWHELFQLFYFINFAINFFIYSACGQQFRVGLKRLVKKARRKVSTCRKRFHKKSENNI